MCDGSELSWVDEIRYLGVFVTRSRKFKCSIDNCDVYVGGKVRVSEFMIFLNL